MLSLFFLILMSNLKASRMIREGKATNVMCTFLHVITHLLCDSDAP